MAKTASLNVSIGAETKRLRSELKKANSMVSKFGRQMNKVGGMIAGAFAVGQVVNFAKASVKAYDVQAKAEAKLLTALGNRHDAYKRLTAVASELQKKTLFGDEETIEAQAFLAAMNLNEEAITRLIPLVQDLATKANMSLSGAADLVAKSVGSSTNALSRYGIVIEGAVGSSERLESAIEGLTNQVGGQSVAAAEAGIGAWTQLSNEIGDVSESIGESMVGFVRFFKTLRDEHRAITSGEADPFLSLSTSVGDLTQAMKELPVDFPKKFKFPTPFDDDDSGVIKEGLIEGVRKQLKELIKLRSEAFTTNEISNFNQEIKRLQDRLVELNNIGLGGSSVTAEGTSPIALLTEDLVEGQTAWDFYVESVRMANQAIKEIDVSTIDMNEALERSGTIAVDVGAVMSQSMTSGIYDLANAMGTGIRSVQDFGAMMLSHVGDFLQQLGAAFIAAGTATATVKETLMKNPYLAIVGGALLVGIGAALKNSVETSAANLGGGGGASGGGAFSSGRGGPGSSIAGLTNDEPIKLEGDFVIRGNDLVAVIDKQNYNNGRTGGRTVGG